MFCSSFCLEVFTKSIVYGAFFSIESVVTIVRTILVSYIFGPLSNTVVDSTIPDKCFSSVSKMASSIMGVMTTIACSKKAFNKAGCFAIGATVKFGIDSVMESYEYGNTENVVVTGK